MKLNARNVKGIESSEKVILQLHLAVTPRKDKMKA
jgi:hypothetical protein